MKVKRFNENSFKDAINRWQTIANATQINTKLSDINYPFRCRFINDNMKDTGICYIIEIYFKNRSVRCSNDKQIFYASFDDVEFIPDIFTFSKYNL